MCTINGDIEDDDTLMPLPPPIRSRALCRKCKGVEAVVVLQGKFPYCRSCFIEVVSHKFFGCLGKSKVMKPTDRVLILCSGSQSSVVLLGLVKTALEQRQRKILSQALVLFIDGGNFLPLTVEERVSLVKEMRETVSEFGFKSYYSPLVEDDGPLRNLQDPTWCSPEYLQTVDQHQLVRSLTGNTSKEDLLVKMRTAAAVSAARKLGCNKIFSAETNDHIASKILSNVALGRGHQLPHDTGFSDNRFDGVTIVRPLRECSRKEIAFYRHMHSLPFVTYRKAATMKGKEESVQKLTERFIAELQTTFPSTVSMVVGTGNKLASKTTSQQDRLPCPMCQGPVDGGEEELSAVSATRVSHLISTLGSCAFQPPSPGHEVVDGGDGCAGDCRCSNKSTLRIDKIEQVFCYGCRLILRDMTGLDELPRNVLEQARHRTRLGEMRQEIEDFLL